MSKELIKRNHDGDIIVYENEEAKWVFSKGRPPHIDDYVIAITVVDKSINIPVMLYLNGKCFRELLRDLGIKIIPPLNDR